MMTRFYFNILFYIPKLYGRSMGTHYIDIYAIAGQKCSLNELKQYNLRKLFIVCFSSSHCEQFIEYLPY